MEGLCHTWVSWQQVTAQGLWKPPTCHQVFCNSIWKLFPIENETQSMKLGTYSPAWAQDLIECQLYWLSWAPLCSVPSEVPFLQPPLLKGEVARHKHFSFLHLEGNADVLNHYVLFQQMLLLQNQKCEGKMNRTYLKIKAFFTVFVLESGQTKLKEIDLNSSRFCLWASGSVRSFKLCLGFL